MKHTVSRSSAMILGVFFSSAHVQLSANVAESRPDYKKLSVLKQLFPYVPILALSATCPPKVRLQSSARQI
jgi:hypothetical protein